MDRRELLRLAAAGTALVTQMRETTAQAALPKLDETVKSLDGIGGMLTKLSVEQRTMLAGLVSAALPALKDLAARVTALPGVGDIAKPTVDGLLSKIEALGKPA